MKAPLHLTFTTDDNSDVTVSSNVPASFEYRLGFAKAVYTSCDLGEFTIQLIEGTDYWLELWWFAAKKNGTVDIAAAEALIAVGLFLQGNPEGELAGYGSVYTYAKTMNVFYIPAGTHRMQLKKEECLLLYFIPPLNSFEGMSIEHPAIKELIQLYNEKSSKAVLLRSVALPKDAWVKLKTMDAIPQKLFALDLPLRQYMIELLNYYSAEMRRQKFSLPVNSSSKEKAVALKEFILANLHDPELGSLDELARRFYISIKTLTKEFKLLTGMTIHQYIIEQRLEHAHQLLTQTKSPLIDIVTASGFTDTSHFIKRFKKKYGHTPRQRT